MWKNCIPRHVMVVDPVAVLKISVQIESIKKKETLQQSWVLFMSLVVFLFFLSMNMKKKQPPIEQHHTGNNGCRYMTDTHTHTHTHRNTHTTHSFSKTWWPYEEYSVSSYKPIIGFYNIQVLYTFHANIKLNKYLTLSKFVIGKDKDLKKESYFFFSPFQPFQSQTTFFLFFLSV